MCKTFTKLLYVRFSYKMKVKTLFLISLVSGKLGEILELPCASEMQFFLEVIFFGIFRASLQKFGQKFFAPATICLLRHQCFPTRGSQAVFRWAMEPFRIIQIH